MKRKECSNCQSKEFEIIQYEKDDGSDLGTDVRIRCYRCEYQALTISDFVFE